MRDRLEFSAVEDAGGVGGAVARNLRRLRADRGWSLDVLAKRSGVSKGVLVQIEQGQGNPSLTTLVRLSDSFGITLAQLVEGRHRPEVNVVRAGAATVLWSDDTGSRGELLLGLDRDEHVELWRWTLHPGSGHRSESHLAGTREMIHVTAGELTLEVAGQTHVIGPGDAVHYPSDRGHTYRNEGPTPCHFQMVVIMPSSGC
jgi:transcriptional regulator with XRE-family HTH domain